LRSSALAAAAAAAEKIRTAAVLLNPTEVAAAQAVGMAYSHTCHPHSGLLVEPWS